MKNFIAHTKFVFFVTKFNLGTKLFTENFILTTKEFAKKIPPEDQTEFPKPVTRHNLLHFILQERHLSNKTHQIFMHAHKK